MKEELEELGFVSSKKNQYTLIVGKFTISVNIFNIVWIEKENEAIKLFPYNHEKLKQLIKLLS